jgi:hypothetical protein
MDISPNKLWFPKEWESHANRLLAEKYTHANYIPIPDHDRGDGGIEGFSLDGHAYQMYCPEGAHTVSKLYEKQRTKMNDDVNKFINNKDNKLAKIFGSTKIKRWILVVPSNQTKDLVMYATKKTNQILEANLDYVDNSDFRVLIWDRTTFEKEERELLLSGINVLKLSPLKVDPEVIHSFVEDGEPEHYSNIKNKTT